MTHLDPFQARETLVLPIFEDEGWHLKRYSILADGRTFDDTVAAAASHAAIARLPAAGRLDDQSDNHSVGFQIIHFAQVAIVSPVFYWQWGSVLANVPQMRASWETPTRFNEGCTEVVGCVWEMDVVAFEVAAWKALVLNGASAPVDRIAQYLQSTHLT